MGVAITLRGWILLSGACPRHLHGVDYGFMHRRAALAFTRVCIVMNLVHNGVNIRWEDSRTATADLGWDWI